MAGGTEVRRRRFPAAFLIIAAVVAIALGLIIFGLLPPTPPPYVT